MSNLLDNLTLYETKLGKLTGDKATFFEKLFYNSQFKEVSDIKKIVDNIDAIDITGLT